MAPVYIDESTGNDTIGDGTQNAPYQSLAYAVFVHGSGAETDLQIRKDATVPFDKPSPTSLKKAVKGADGLRKKHQRAAELAEREAKERAEVEKKLAESRKIVLIEDASLPKAVKVSYRVYIICLYSVNSR